MGKTIENTAIIRGGRHLPQANLCSPEHSKLCFLQHEILRAAKNKLAARLMARGDLLQSRKSYTDD
jgi:hypothetical protein